MEEDLLIKKYPYLGYSPNLIECFSLIGYEENLLPQIIEEYKNTGNNLFSPSVLSSIISNRDFGIIDNDLIISQIFPDYPDIIKISNCNNMRNSISQEIPKTKNIIYSFIIDSPDGTNKLFYTCFGFIFYERYKHHDINNNIFNLEEYYIPKAFCIISQYSYFSFSYYICNNLYNSFLKNSEQMPIEIIIYNLVNFIPSPLNYNFNYNIFNYELDIQPYNLPQLSGYPYLDFDLTELFNILPLNLIIEIFLLTVIEQSILFFSSNLEILNMIMFIMYSLNYPCNNSTYFWHIVSISKNDINEENRFISQIMTSLLGVNASYDESINTFPFGDYHFIVDIDKKKIIFKESSNANMNLKKEIEKLSNLKSYFNNIIKDKNVNSVFLKQFIENLKKDLENIINKEEQVNQKNKKDICFFKNSYDKEKNKLIQECFYNFNINLLMIFYQNTKLIIGLNKIRLEQKNDMIIINKKEDSLNEEEKYFCELFKSSSKYKIYFENFIENSESHELLKIPLILSEEFINLKMKYQNKKPIKISFFKIIDNLYNSQGNGTLKISLNNFYFQFCEDKLKSYFKDYNDKPSDNNDLKFFTFNKNILHKYVFLLNNHYESKKLNELFPSIKIKKESILLIETKIIVQTIQSELEKKNLIKPSNYLLYASVYIFSIFIPLYSYRNLLYYLDKFFICFKQIDFFLRFYFYIIIQAFYKYYLINNNTKKFPDMKFNNVKIIIYLLMNHLKDEYILPTEEMVKIQNIFFSKNLTIKGKGTFKEKNINQIELFERDNDNELDLKNKNIFQIFMKYNFGFKGFYKPKMIIDSLMKGSGNSTMTFKDDNENNDKKRKARMIVIKIYDEIYKTELYTPKKIFELSKFIYIDYIKNPNLSIENINIKILREILVNLIQYSKELDELKIPYEFFINGLYLTRDLTEFNRTESRNI